MIASSPQAPFYDVSSIPGSYPCQTHTGSAGSSPHSPYRSFLFSSFFYFWRGGLSNRLHRLSEQIGTGKQNPFHCLLTAVPNFMGPPAERDKSAHLATACWGDSPLRTAASSAPHSQLPPGWVPLVGQGLLHVCGL